MSFNQISVIGLGYVGLPTAALFASRKKKVSGVDVNQFVVDTVNQGRIHIFEPDLELIVRAAISERYLEASSKPKPADAFLIAVPTPFKRDADGKIPAPDLSFIKAASKSIAAVLKKGDLVILESTAPVGTTEQMAAWLEEDRPDLSFPQTHGEDADINIAYCPERVLPGRVIRELEVNDRVIGGMSSRCSKRSVELFKTFVSGECVVTDARTAEMVKLTENSFRDVNIAFANELSMICEKSGVSVWELIELANRHPRVNILNPGPGVGGHCIAVDPWFIVSESPDKANLIKQAREVNENKVDWVVEKIVKETNVLKKIKKRKIIVACLGATYKANIDDTRASPSIEIINKLSKKHLEIIVVEPMVKKLIGLDRSVKISDLGMAIKEADLILFLVAHEEFQGISADALKNKTIIDICNVREIN